MKKTCALALVIATFIGGATTAGARDNDSSATCWVDDELLMSADCQSIADASWEGLSMEEQEAIRATGLTGTPLDQLVIDTRQAILGGATIMTEDTPPVFIIQPATPQSATELPRTS